VLVEEGQAVTAGQPLVVLEQEDTAAGVMNARGTYLDAKTSYEKARMDVQRFEALYEKGAVSKEALDNVRFALENARGKLDAARGNLNSAESALGGTTVTTPRSGIIQKRYFQEGYYAKEGTALFNIADISTLQAKIDIPEGYVNSVAVGGQVEFTIPSMRGENKKVRGIITRISPVAVQPARTFEAEVTVDNRNSLLRGGMYAEALITAIPKENVLTIPMTAISMRDDQRTCYVIEDGKAVRKVLTTGYIGENLVEVLSGVSEKDHVITGGLNKVREGADVKVSEKGMAAND
jgi:RND family efflux transporter MFP subunit